jgi:hypothetical protein
MKKLLFIAALVLLMLPAVAPAQKLSDLMKYKDDPSLAYNGIAAGFGTTIIDGKPYVLFHVAPQFEYENFGIGFDGNIRIGTDGKFRKKDWDESYDILRWINYLSYGKPHDSLYARIGGLTRASIGNSTIVSSYSNNSSYDERRIGLAGAVRLGPIGFEGLTSDLFRRGLLVGRPFIHPFQFIPLIHKLPVLGNIQLGVTGSFDYDTNATKIIPNRPPYVERIPIDSTEDSVVIHDYLKKSSPFTIYGIDLKLPIVESENADLRVYGDFVKIVNFNHGFILGARTMFKLGESLLDLRVERSLFKNGFLPNYYNTFYERDRYDTEADTNDYITKATLLDDSTSGDGNGFKLGGFLSLDQIVQGTITFMHLDNLKGRDWMDVYLNFPEVWYGFTGSISYSRKNIRSVEDAFAIDKRSLVQARVSVPLFAGLYGSVIARYSFDRDKSGKLTSQAMYEPKVDFIFRW